MRTRTLPTLTLWVAAALLGAQYISSTEIPSQEKLNNQIEEARWRLGAIRLSPWLGLRDASFVVTTDEQNEQDDDFTATVGAGLRAYLRTGPKVIWAAHALPEYSWWREAEDKRRLNGRYGAGVFAYFNRLGLEVSQRRNEQQGFFSSEIQELTTTGEDISRLALDLRIARRIWLFGAFTRTEFTHREERLVFALLDREAETARIGIRYRTPRGWSLALGFEDSTNQFTADARNLSNSGTTETLEIGHDGDRFGSQLRLASQSLDPVEGSEFPPFEATTGSLETLWRMTPNLSLSVYGSRRLQYSVRETYSSYLSDRYGLRLGLEIRKSSLGFFAETGKDEFEPLDPGSPGQLDEVTAFGMTYRLFPRKLFGLSLGIARTEYDSDVDIYDRDVTTWSATIELGRLREKLQLGDQSGGW
ncbi:MAG: hypothetical protein GY856_07090 [bacterium]|nr:hypothetical protein [bacterium]